MAATITDAGNGVITSSAASVATGATVTAAIGDWLVVLVAVDNSGSGGAAPTITISDSDGVNSYTQRALINYDPAAASAGATLGIYTCAVTDALTNATVTAAFSPNGNQAGLQVYRVQPGATETVSFITADTTGSTGNATAHTAAQVSVTSGDIIFGAASIETDDAVTGDTDTTNGSWSTILSRLGDGGADASAMTCSSQYKTVTGTGNQDWQCDTANGRDSARSYLVLRSAVAAIEFTPAAVTAAWLVLASTLAGAGNATLTPGAVTAGWTVPASTLSADPVTFTPPAVPAGWTLPDSMLSGSGDATLTPAAVTAAWTVPASVLSADSVTLAPGAATAAWSVPDPTFEVEGGEQTLTPGPVTAAWTTLASTLAGSGDATLAPAAVVATWTAPGGTLAGSGDASLPSDVGLATWTVPASTFTVEGGPQTLTPDPVTASWLVPSATVSGSGNATFTPAAVPANWTTPDSVLSPDTVTLTPPAVPATWTVPAALLIGAGDAPLTPPVVITTWGIPVVFLSGGEPGPTVVQLVNVALTGPTLQNSLLVGPSLIDVELASPSLIDVEFV